MSTAQRIQEFADKIIRLLLKEGATENQAADALSIAQTLRFHTDWKKASRRV